jgi:RNA polymerase sigma-70 factor, ECF subfamily
VQSSDEAELAALFRRALGGDEAAYGRFLERIARLLRASLKRKLGAGALDPEDIVQDSLLAIHNKRHTWRQDLPVLPWVHAIARYKLVDAFRRRGRRVELDIADFAEVLPAETVEPTRDREVAAALDGLPDGQRRVVTSISVEGRSIAETAAALSMRQTAVRVALHRGLSAIAARFGRDNP